LNFSPEIAVLVDDASAYLPPTEAQLSAYTEAEREDIARQASQASARIATESRAEGRMNSEEAQRKRREREAKRVAQAAERKIAQDADPSLFLVDVSDHSKTPLNPRPDTPASTTPGYTAPYTVEIPASSSSLAWYNPTSSPKSSNGPIYETIAAARDAGIWMYPMNEAQRARCAVFRDLWEQGYFMGGGIKFGGDWLVYPGNLASTVWTSRG
jgi:tRNA-splicing endonuclease subunit Sen34